MRLCKQCRVAVDAHLKRCPLCLEAIEAEDFVTEKAHYPDYAVSMSTEKRDMKLKLWVYISVFSAVLCLLINLLTWKGVPWFLYVVSSVLYAWLFVGHSVFSKKHIGHKLLMQLIGASLLLIIIDAADGRSNWALNYVVPFLIIGTSVTITIIVFVRHQLWRDYMIYDVITIALGFLLLFTSWVSSAKVLWPSIAAGFVVLMALLSLIIFASRKLITELKKRFHI